MGTKNLEAIRHQILRLTLADVAFLQSKALIQLILSQPDWDAHFAAGMLTGVCVSYAKPFKEGEGLGKLSSKYGDFPNEHKRHSDVHEQVIRARDKIYGHRDLQDAHTFFGGAVSANEMEAIEIEVREDGSFGLMTNEPHLSPEFLREILELIEFQQARTKHEIGELLKAFAGNKKFPLGRYKLCESALKEI